MTAPQGRWYAAAPMDERPDGAPSPAPAGGESDVWSIISTLLAGPLVWGLVGYGLDVLVDSSGRPFTAAGVVLGAVTAFYIVYVRHGRDPSAGDPPPPTPGDAR